MCDIQPISRYKLGFLSGELKKVYEYVDDLGEGIFPPNLYETSGSPPSGYSTWGDFIKGVKEECEEPLEIQQREVCITNVDTGEKGIPAYRFFTIGQDGETTTLKVEFADGNNPTFPFSIDESCGCGCETAKLTQELEVTPSTVNPDILITGNTVTWVFPESYADVPHYYLIANGDTNTTARLINIDKTQIVVRYSSSNFEEIIRVYGQV